MKWHDRAIMGEVGALALYWTRDDGVEITPIVTANIPTQRVEYELTDRHGRAVGPLYSSVRKAKEACRQSLT